MNIEKIKKGFGFDPRTAVLDVFLEKGALTGEVSEKRYLKELKKSFGANRVTLLPFDSGIVGESIVDMRKLPDGQSELVNQAVSGSVLRLMKNEKGWILCQKEDGYIGWIEGKNVVPKKKEAMRGWRKNRRMIKKIFCDVKEKPDGKAESVCRIFATSFVSQRSVSSSWAEVTLPGRRKGFVPSDALRSGLGSSDDIVENACEFLKTPYLWGGTSMLGIDCSGLVQTSFLANGYRLPRDADMQHVFCKRVSNPKKGDLFFFSENEKSITHVGICLSNWKFIHASGKRKEVCINDLLGESEYERFLSSIFVGVRRFPKGLKERRPQLSS